MKSASNEPSLTEAAVSAVGMGMKVGEIAMASSIVIGARLMLIGAAMRNPLSGDYRELSRMMPEKVEALSRSGMALMSQIGVAQRDMMAQFTDSKGLMAGGVPTPATMMKLASEAGRRGARAMLWPLATSEAALAPVHSTVTSNAKRLRHGGKKAGR